MHEMSSPSTMNMINSSIYPSIYLPIRPSMKISGPTSPLASASCQLILLGSSSVFTRFSAPASPCTQNQNEKGAERINQNQHSCSYRHHRPIKRAQQQLPARSTSQNQESVSHWYHRFAMRGRIDTTSAGTFKHTLRRNGLNAQTGAGTGHSWLSGVQSTKNKHGSISFVVNAGHQPIRRKSGRSRLAAVRK